MSFGIASIIVIILRVKYISNLFFCVRKPKHLFVGHFFNICHCQTVLQESFLVEKMFASQSSSCPDVSFVSASLPDDVHGIFSKTRFVIHGDVLSNIVGKTDFRVNHFYAVFHMEKLLTLKMPE
ncbi:hypothetical protein TNIN_93931 [Trichonephila inaurata madagascariensis]|uniref:Uncharacterized protein n=1 Tax=Trichonephila inaurata madagascariensis TaxID=2747483 RepID=A0A8X6X6M4_9ARAC|nr:hypothetical protein TNIN_93931 [Trichonephila inaurata madagascariensis]